MSTRPITVSLSFIRLSVTDKIALGTVVPANLLANPLVFVTPDIAPAVLTTTNTDLETKNNAYISAGGGTKASAELVAAEKTWDGLFRVAAQYVSRVAAGRKEIIALTGFETTSGENVPASLPAITVPTLAAATGGISVKVNNKKINGSKGYLTLLNGLVNDITFEQQGRQIDIFKDGQFVLSISVNTQGKTSFEGIDTGKTVKAICFAYNKAGIGPAGESNSVEVK